MNNLKFIKYENITAGWEGHIDDEDGNTVYWVGQDGVVIPDFEIDNMSVDNPDDEGLDNPIGRIIW